MTVELTMEYVSMRISQAIARLIVVIFLATLVLGLNVTIVLASPNDLPPDIRKDAEAAVVQLSQQIGGGGGQRQCAHLAQKHGRGGRRAVVPVQGEQRCPGRGHG